MDLTLTINSFEFYKDPGGSYSVGPCSAYGPAPYESFYPCDIAAVGGGQEAAHNWFDAQIGEVCSASMKALEKSPTSMAWTTPYVSPPDTVLTLSPLYEYCLATTPPTYADCGDNYCRFTTNSYLYTVQAGACCIEDTGETWVRYWATCSISCSVVPNTNPLVSQSGGFTWVYDVPLYYPNLQDVGDYGLANIPCDSYGAPDPIAGQPRGGWPMIYLGQFGTAEALQTAVWRAAAGSYLSYDAASSGDADCAKTYGMNVSATVGLA